MNALRTIPGRIGRRFASLASLAVLVLVATVVPAHFVVSANAGEDVVPREVSKPDWVNADGTIAVERLPSSVPVYGPGGEVIGEIDPRAEMFRERETIPMPVLAEMTPAERDEFVRRYPPVYGDGTPGPGVLSDGTDDEADVEP